MISRKCKDEQQRLFASSVVSFGILRYYSFTRVYYYYYYYYYSIRKLRLTCRTQDAGARGWLGRRRGQDAGRTRALCGPDAGRVDARRGPDAGQTRCQVISWRYCIIYAHITQ